MALVQQSASGLDAAERIRLEAHLEECPSCATEAATLERLVEVLREADWSLKARARENVLERALRVPSEVVVVGKPSARRAALALVAAAAAVAAVLALFFMRPEVVRLERSSAAGSIAARVPRPEPAPAARQKDDSCDLASVSEALAGTRSEFGRAAVEVLRPSRLCWRRETATLELAGGAIRVEVSPGSPAGFHVATERFVVQVVGTVFEVDLEGVAVIRGKVRVLAAQGGAQLTMLGPGQSWSARSTKASVIPAATVDARLAQARRHLAAGRVAPARAELRQLSSGSLEPLQRAEVQSLLAECSLVEGKLDDAARAYGEVASRHPGSLTGETALFAQARAELRAGRREAARARLENYLARYPNGRFRREARAHLRSMAEAK